MPRRSGHGLIVGKFYPPHAGHHHLIAVAAAACRRVTVVVAPASTDSIPLDLRLAWLREAHAATPWVRFVGVIDDHRIDYDDPAVWDAHCALFARAIGDDPVDTVFTSEPYGDELARRFAADNVSVDPRRHAYPVSGTAVRADPVAHWRHLTPAVRAWLTRRVVVVGAESTGTTTLARELAAALRRRGGVWADTRWVPEYGRELTERKLAARRVDDRAATVFDVTWTAADFVDVALAQNAAEDAAARAGGPILVCDTDSRATAVWEERYLGRTGPATVELARRPDLYLLTDDVGVPFEDDGLRDGEHLRSWMTGRFRDVLRASGVATVELTGPAPVRLAAALAACDELLAKGWRFTPPPSAPPG
jgi:HTH-type transcriptional regulator, transcriptional repressor of NAD biosynthesis genes